MSKTTKGGARMGMNRSGIMASPVDSKRMIEGADTLTPAMVGAADGAAIRTRLAYARAEGSLGSVPPPASVKGAVKAVTKVVQGRDPTVFMDQLGGRLAFERTGVRLYDAMLIKLAAEGSWDGGPTEQQLKDIRAEELSHFAMLTECIEALGGDPTAMTPSADVGGVASTGILKLLGDPRVTLGQALQGLLIAELADNDSWALLASLAEAMGQPDYVARFRTALANEQEHLRLVRGWVSMGVIGAAGRAQEPVQHP